MGRYEVKKRGKEREGKEERESDEIEEEETKIRKHDVDTYRFQCSLECLCILCAYTPS
jgi:hypothetical protein